ncbi:solute carrier family 40 member 1-like isoform X2 [Paramacrobiotus metropolitanus]|uniref:solute carrier family 40 member 1-like isoform X2 n=1 Tax=Paramacrobiotus metropolitanus TaxID=2943436 RepID=UPI0024462545|nr:solute carrier family 40 member 1-like isoform X2 [Paramacrobiotus metropolitanus]
MKESKMKQYSTPEVPSDAVVLQNCPSDRKEREVEGANAYAALPSGSSSDFSIRINKIASDSTLDTVTSDYGSHDENHDPEHAVHDGLLLNISENKETASTADHLQDPPVGHRSDTGFFGTLTDDPAVVLYCGKFLQAWRVPCSYKARTYSYCARALPHQGDRMWIFSIPILLLELHRHPMPALFLPALYGFCSGASTIVFGPLMGDWVDQTSRLKAAKAITIFQNGLIAAAAFLLAGTIRFQNLLSNGGLFICIAFLMLLSFSANIFYAGSVVVLEKDWVGVIAGDNKARLAVIISAVRRIELITNVVCPLVMAQVMTFAGKDVCALFIGMWSFLSIFAEYFTLKRVWILAQDLMLKPLEQKRKKQKSVLVRACNSCRVIFYGWGTFAASRVSTAAISVAFLEATVLMFSGVTSGYAIQQGFSNTVVALLAGGDALTGIFSTFLFPKAREILSLEAVTLASMLVHMMCGLVAVSSNWMPGSPFDPYFFIREVNETYALNYTTAVPDVTPATSPIMTSLAVFSAALTVGRLAFWMIDLAGSQIILENIQAKERGIFCAVHYSLKKLMNRLKYLLALFLAWPQVFGYLIIASQAFSTIGYLFFLSYCKRKSVKQ